MEKKKKMLNKDKNCIDLSKKTGYIPNEKTKIIFVTGGVISGIGKGIAAASIGNLLTNCGYKVFMQKLDPYLNIDPGVLSPYEHGEVFVTNDGGETDLDLGYYERFLGIELTKDSNYTNGRISLMVFEKEREGKFCGKTVQIIPHFTHEIINVICQTINKHQPDFHIVEIGGTVGDIESNVFINAIAYFSFLNPQRCFFIHTVFVPWLNTSKEFKTKPAQFSLHQLSSFGIRPNLIFLRSEKTIPLKTREKISNIVFKPVENVISLPDVDNIYQVPLYLRTQNILSIIFNYFNMEQKEPNMKKWEEFVTKLSSPKKVSLNVAMIGKYIELEDAYKSIKEALIASSAFVDVELNLKWISSCDINKNNVEKVLKNIDAVIVLPGFGYRGFEGKIISVDYTRKAKIPTLGICFGMQAMTINQARIKNIKNPTSSEFNEELDQTKEWNYIFDIIHESNTAKIGGTLRLGSGEVELVPNTLISKIYDNKKIVLERSRHRYEVNKKFINDLEDDEFIFSSFNPQKKLIESCELKNHPFYIGVQYHPEFTSKPLEPNKLFVCLLEKAKEIKNKNKNK